MDPCEKYSALAFAWLALATAAVSLLFLMLPALDIAVSAMFYGADHPLKPFPERFDPWLRALRQAGFKLPAIFMILLALALLIRIGFPKRKLPIKSGDAVWLLLSAGLASGLLVEALFKTFWGRARPRDIVEFGGEQAFTPAWIISDACPVNCSFVSGEASTAFWLVALACLLPQGYRIPAALLAFVLAGLISFNRVVFGGHFVSDVVISGLLTLTVIAGMKAVLTLPEVRPHVSDDGPDRYLARLGEAVRQRLGR